MLSCRGMIPGNILPVRKEPFTGAGLNYWNKAILSLLSQAF
jgi:hypothetical protein